MNIWAMRNKAKAQEMQALATAPAAEVEPVTNHIEPPSTPQTVSVDPFTVGLNDLFSLEESKLNELSPNHTFSKLRAPTVVRRIGLNELLTMED